MISVCIATYNGEAFLKEQLQSVLVQIGPEDEVIVSDDHSTDRTLAVIASFDDSRIRLIHYQGHSCKNNFINAMQHARGDVIFLSDQDDVWLPGKYERCLEELQHVDLVCTNSMLVDEHLQVINPNFFSIYQSGSGVVKNSINNTYYGSCMAFRRTLLQWALPMPQSAEIGHDIWLGIVAEIVGKVRFVETPYLLYRRHSSTVTQTTSLLNRSNRPWVKKIWSRVIVLWNVLRFYLNYLKNK